MNLEVVKIKTAVTRRSHNGQTTLPPGRFLHLLKLGEKYWVWGYTREDTALYVKRKLEKKIAEGVLTENDIQASLKSKPKEVLHMTFAPGGSHNTRPAYYAGENNRIGINA